MRYLHASRVPGHSFSALRKEDFFYIRKTHTKGAYIVVNKIQNFEVFLWVFCLLLLSSTFWLRRLIPSKPIDHCMACSCQNGSHSRWPVLIKGVLSRLGLCELLAQKWGTITMRPPLDCPISTDHNFFIYYDTNLIKISQCAAFSVLSYCTNIPNVIKST